MKTVTFDESVWQLVPVKPTDEMLNATNEHIWGREHRPERHAVCILRHARCRTEARRRCSMSKQLIAERDAMALDEAGGFYMRHVMAMTHEELHSKMAIAAELATGI